MKPTRTINFLFVGHQIDKPERSKFIIEVTPEEMERASTHPYPSNFTGKVIASKHKARFVGEVDKRFCNPFYEFAHYGNSPFVRTEKTTLDKVKK